jgi:nucleoside-diphosphate-sugar epimerase
MNEQVLVTGISGFIAKHIALKLLQNGYNVRGTLRTPARADEVRKTLQVNGADISKLTFYEADLGSDSGWTEAARDCAYVQHVASPFPIKQPRDRESLVPEAGQGALRVLDAACGVDVKRIVFTSSMAAMMYRANRPKEITVTENDWTDPDWKPLSAYIVSKTRAEKAAWNWADEKGWRQLLTVVNPGFVLGPALDGKIGTSLEVIKLFMKGAYPAVPPAHYPVVDVRDLAELFVRAMTTQDAGGRRIIGAANTLSLAEMGRILRDAFPEYAKKIPTRTLPGFIVRFVANFDRALKSVIPDLGVIPVADNAYVIEMTGISFKPAEAAVRAAGHSLVEHSLV